MHSQEIRQIMSYVYQEFRSLKCEESLAPFRTRVQRTTRGGEGLCSAAADITVLRRCALELEKIRTDITDCIDTAVYQDCIMHVDLGH